MTRLALCLALFCALLASAAPSAAQSRAVCAPRDVVVARLAEAYGETRQSIGLGANNQVMELYASASSGSWTITVTNAAGLTCLIASGQAFEALADTLPPTAEDA